MAVTPPDLKAGDRVRLVDDERLDIPDAIALNELPLEYLVLLQGALGGASKHADASASVGLSGCISNLTFDASTVAATVVNGPAMFLHYRPQVGGQVAEAQCVWYDPSASGQQTTIDLSAFAPGEDTPWIWARRVPTNDNTDTRRKWDSGLSDEVAFATQTRTRHRVEFVASLSDLRAVDDDYFVVAKIDRWESGFPFIYSFHPFDAGAWAQDQAQRRWAHADIWTRFSQVGINQAFALLADVLSRIVDSTSGTHFATAPASGLKQLRDSTLTNAANIATNASALAPLTPVPALAPKWWVELAWIGSQWFITRQSGGVGITVNGVWSVELSVPEAVLTVLASTCHNSGSGSSGFNSTVCCADPNVAGSSGSTSINVFMSTYQHLAGSTNWAATPGTPTANSRVVLAGYYA